MSFRLVPNSVTLGDLELRNSRNRRVISPNSVAFGADYVKVVGNWLQLHQYFLQRKCRPHNIFTALHGIQTRSSEEISVCLSVRLSVCQTRVL